MAGRHKSRLGEYLQPGDNSRAVPLGKCQTSFPGVFQKLVPNKGFKNYQRKTEGSERYPRNVFCEYIQVTRTGEKTDTKSEKEKEAFTFSSSCGLSPPACPVFPESQSHRCPSQSLKYSKTVLIYTSVYHTVSSVWVWGIQFRQRTCKGRQSLSISAYSRFHSTPLLLLPKQSANRRLDAFLLLAANRANCVTPRDDI